MVVAKGDGLGAGFQDGRQFLRSWLKHKRINNHAATCNNTKPYPTLNPNPHTRGRREWGGVTPPENKLSANEGICRQTKNNIPQNVKLNRDIQQNSPQRHKKVFSGGIPPPPPLHWTLSELPSLTVYP